MEEPRHQRGPRRLSHYQQRQGNLQAWVIEALIGAASLFCPPPQFQFVSGQLNLLQPSTLFRDKVNLRWPHFRFSPGQITSIKARPPSLPVSNLSWLRAVISTMWALCTCERHISLPFITAGRCTMPPIPSLAASHKRPFSIRRRQYLF